MKLKAKITIAIIILFYLPSNGQSIRLKIIGNSIKETTTIDSIGYVTKNINYNQAQESIKILQKKLNQIGYLNNYIHSQNKENDSIYEAVISLGKNIKYAYIYIGIKNNLEINNLTEFKKDTLKLHYSELEPFLKQTTQKFEALGYSFTKIKLNNIKVAKNNLYADLDIELGKSRMLNSIEIKYSNNQTKKIFLKGAEKQINKKFKNKTFNQETVKSIYDEFSNFNFINQIKYPEILFTMDTTKVFVYLEKSKANNFDGYLGFNNKENEKLKINGYLNLNLINLLKNGEEISINWKNVENNQKTFDAKLSIPYLFHTQIALKGEINIFKQDSIFQNTNTKLNLGYAIKYNKRIYIGLENTESSDIQNSNTSSLNDYKNEFYTLTFEYNKRNSKQNIIPLKSYCNINIGTGERSNTTNHSISQNFVNASIMNNFYFNEKNIIYTKFQNYYLKSDSYLNNELYRFGGVNSIRGFVENSLQTSTMIGLMTEYRYLISKNIYLNSILDYCYYEDPNRPDNEKTQNNLLGIGLGLCLETANGLLHFSITNGKKKNEEINFYNTNVSISYNVKF